MQKNVKKITEQTRNSWAKLNITKICLTQGAGNDMVEHPGIFKIELQFRVFLRLNPGINQ